MTSNVRLARSQPDSSSPSIGWLNGDVLFVFATFATSLFVLVLPKVGPGLFVALPILQAFYHPERVTRVFYRCGPILIVPLFCMISSIWSPVPGLSLYSATLFLVTAVIGLIMGNGVSEKSLLRGIFLAFGLYAAVCFLIGVSTGFFWSGALRRVPFIVLAGSKNVTGDVAALGTMIAATMLVSSLRDRQPIWVLASLALIAVELLIVLAALSTGAVVSMLVGLGVLGVLTLSGALPVAARSLGLLAGLAFVTIAALTQKIWMSPILSSVMKAGGKDSTFTGRVYIWSRAEVMIQQRPTLGIGFGGFWVPGNLEAEAIWKRLFITNKFGFNFHNTRLDILVNLGYVGLALFALAFAIYGSVLLVRTVQKPGAMSIFFVSLLAYEATRMGFESIGYGIFHHATFLLFAALAWGVRSPASQRSPAPAPAGLRNRLRAPAQGRVARVRPR